MPRATLLSLLLLTACATTPERSAATPATWTQAAPLRHARSAHAVVSDGMQAFALAGTGPQGPVLEVERFDGTAWHPETRLPGEGLNAPAAVLHAGRLYVLGGFHGVSNLPSDAVHVYDLRTRTWSRGAPLPAPRGGTAAVVLDGRIHLVGGGNSERTLADHAAYDPARDAWVQLAPLPRSKGSPAAVVHEGRLWVLGGRSGASDFGEVDVYDAARDAWTPGPAIVPRGTHGAAVYRGVLHLFGGESQAQRSALAEVLRLESGHWVPGPPLPTARTYARAVVVGDAVYVVGGNLAAGNSHGAAGSAVVERFGP